MPLKRLKFSRILIYAYHCTIVFRFCLRLTRRFLKKNSHDSRILLFHEINSFEEKSFENIIRNSNKRHSILDPNDLSSVPMAIRARTGREVFVTFDDGFESDFKIAQEVLNPMGIKAIFFVIPGFIEATDKGHSKEFLRDQLYSGISKEFKIPSNLRSMSWDQIRTLVEQGHIIGSHSMSHRRLSEITELGELEYEIIESGKVIEKQIDAKVRHFAFPFGNVTGFSKPAADIAIANYEFVFSGIRGSNFRLPRGRILRRETVFPWDPKGFELAVLAGGADKRYEKQLKILDSWCEQSTESNWS